MAVTAVLPISYNRKPVSDWFNARNLSCKLTGDTFSFVTTEKRCMSVSSQTEFLDSIHSTVEISRLVSVASKTVAFYTNLNVDDQLRVEREWTKKVINRYRRRGIESAFQSLNKFLPSTSSKESVVRLFYVPCWTGLTTDTIESQNYNISGCAVVTRNTS